MFPFYKLSGYTRIASVAKILKLTLLRKWARRYFDTVECVSYSAVEASFVYHSPANAYLSFVFAIH